MTDIEIATSCKLKNIIKIAKKIKLKKDNLVILGNDKAKIKLNSLNLKNKKTGKLVLVTSINPTKAGNGKTTVSIGLADALNLMHKNACLALREPSLGPVFGMKGGATGGGYSQVAPMDEINLHFTGDFHAITAANNLLCAMIDNHIFQGNELNIDENNILFNRCLDVNDRALRDITINSSYQRKEKFNITAASEIMAIMCLSQDLEELKSRLGNILVAYNKNGEPVFARDLKAENALAILLKDALNPSLVQTLGGTPAIIHCGPFANIAHGCNSIVATKTALSLADYCITEAGFGADLGAEKFLDFKCQNFNLKPNCIVLIVTIPALKINGGVEYEKLKEENIDALEKGFSNMDHHIKVLKDVYKVPFVVTINKHISDTENELNCLNKHLDELGVSYCVNSVWADGGKGGIDLANEVIKKCEEDSCLSFAYKFDEEIETKVEKVAKKIYGASSVVFSEIAKQKIEKIKALGYSNYPVIMAKTQYSLSDNAKLLGEPKNFEINVKDVELKTGAGFIVVILNDILLMPGLSKKPAAVSMKIDANCKIEGLF